MTTAFEATATIAADRTAVWSTLTDWSRLPEWTAEVSAATGPAPPSLGDDVMLTTPRGERTSTIAECSAETVVALRSTSGPITAQYRYQLSDGPAGSTSVRVVADCRVAGPLRVLAPLIRRSLRRADGEQLDLLRSLIEAP